MLSDGVLFAFSAFFRSYKAVRFQVLRPMNSTQEHAEDSTGEDRPAVYKLLQEIRVIPSVIRQREDVVTIIIKIVYSCYLKIY